MKFQAFIFDLEITLVDTIHDLAESVNEALKTLKFPTHSMDTLKNNSGNGILHLVQSSLPKEKQNNERILSQALELVAKQYSLCWKKNIRLYPEVSKLLDTLMLKKIPLAILSDKPDEFTQEICRHLFHKWEFVTIASAPISNTHNPLSTVHVINSLGVDPESIGFVGKGKSDIKIALAAGVEPIAITWGYYSKEELAKIGAKKFIETPLELLNYC